MKLFKRAATFCMAAAMALSLSVTAFANQGDVVATGTLTVTGDQLAGKKVTAVRMFTARATEGSTGTDYVFDTYELEEEWLGFFQSADIGYTEAGIVIEGGNNAADADDALAYMMWLASQEETSYPEFAHKAQKYYRENANEFSELTSTETAAKIGEATNGTVTFSSLVSGYYLVFPEGGGTGNSNRATDAMLINIPTNEPNATWNIKSTYPTVEKQVNTGSGNADNGSAQVGDVVTFTLTSTVPDMSDFTTYVFQFTDKLPEGLTLVDAAEDVLDPVTSFANTDVTLTIAEKNVKTANFEASAVILAEDNWSDFEGQGVTVDDVGKTLMTVKITNLKATDLLESAPATAATGDKIVLTYKAMINEKAETTDPITNEASVQYSNDPNSETLGTSTPDESTVYTYEIDVHKWSAENGGNAAYLEGAAFALSKEGNLGTLSISDAEGETKGKVVNDKGGSVESSLIGLTGSANAYKIDPESNVYTFTTNNSAVIKIQGLEAGTYYLYEVTAPASYNKLKEPIKIEIVVVPVVGNESTTNASFENPVYIVTVNGNTTTGTLGDSVIKVENKKGIQLPETGSIGTIGLTVAGVAVVLAGVMLPRKKKNKEQE